MSRYPWRICRHDTTLDIAPERKRTYEALKARVLEAGSFSVFDATASARDAWKFEALSRDPELKVTQAHFPWYRV